MNFSDIKFKNLEEFGGDLPLPDGRNAHDLRVEPLRKELERLGVPVTAGMPKSRMCGIYSQVLEHVRRENRQYFGSGGFSDAGRPGAAKELARRSA